MDKEKIKRIVEIRTQIRGLGAEKAMLEEDLLTEMVKQEKKHGGAQLRTSFGTFSIVHRRSYEFPSWFEEAKREYKLQEKKARKESTYTVKSGLGFTPADVLDVEPEEFEVELVTPADEGVEATPVKKGGARLHS